MVLPVVASVVVVNLKISVQPADAALSYFNLRCAAYGSNYSASLFLSEVKWANSLSVCPANETILHASYQLLLANLEPAAFWSNGLIQYTAVPWSKAA